MLISKVNWLSSACLLAAAILSTPVSALMQGAETPAALVDQSPPIAPEAQAVDPRQQAHELIERLFAAVDAVRDYRLLMKKTQRIKGHMQAPEEIMVKQRRTPRCVYMKWIGEMHGGREALYCPQGPGDKLLVHDGGLLSFMTLSLDAESRLLRAGELHGINEVGLFEEIELVRRDVDFHGLHPELPAPTIASRMVEGKASTCIDEPDGVELFEVYHSGRRSICIDDQLSLPTSLEVWNTQGVLMETYTYSRIEVNPGFADIDFDRRNPDYNF